MNKAVTQLCQGNAPPESNRKYLNLLKPFSTFQIENWDPGYTGFILWFIIVHRFLVVLSSLINPGVSYLRMKIFRVKWLGSSRKSERCPDLSSYSDPAVMIFARRETNYSILNIPYALLDSCSAHRDQAVVLSCRVPSQLQVDVVRFAGTYLSSAGDPLVTVMCAFTSQIV